MTGLRALVAAILLCVTPAAAQTVPPPRAGAPSVDLHRYQAEQHRLEVERLRIQADQREAFARQIELEARLNRQRLEAARQPGPALMPSLRAPLAPEQERALRRSASERRAATSANVGQIDAWLDRDRD